MVVGVVKVDYLVCHEVEDDHLTVCVWMVTTWMSMW